MEDIKTAARWMYAEFNLEVKRIVGASWLLFIKNNNKKKNQTNKQ